MLDCQADQIAEMRQQINDVLDGQRMLVQIYQQEHEARVEADRRFNRFIESQERLNQQLTETIERLDRIISFRSDNGSQN